MQNKIIKQYEKLTGWKTQLLKNKRYRVLDKNDKVLRSVSIKEMENYIKHKTSKEVKQLDKAKECLLSKLIFSPSTISESDTHWKVVSAKVKLETAHKLDKLAIDLKTTPSTIIRAYIEKITKEVK